MTPFALSMAVAFAATVVVAIPLENEGKPTFKLLSSRSGLMDPRTDIPEIEVMFGNGQTDTLVLRHYNALPDSRNIDHTRLCNYLGNLKHEEDARVSVTGCVDERNLEGIMYISLLSNRSPYQKSFSMDLDGNVEPINIMGSNSAYLEKPKDDITAPRADEKRTKRIRKKFREGGFADGDELGLTSVEEIAAEATTTGVPAELDVTIKLGTDTGARDKITKSGKTVANWVSEMFTHVQNHYYHPTLGHRITFKIVGEPLLYNEKLRVSETDLDKLSIHSAKLNEADIDLYAWITNEGVNGGTGLAWLGSACTSGDATCTKDCFAKTSVTQGPSRRQAIIETAETMAHEIGHNLGMSHDFKSNKQICKNENDGSHVSCTKCSNWDPKARDGRGALAKVTDQTKPGVGNNPGECCTGFMDYDDHPEYWSDCSVRNFEQHYNSKKWGTCMPKGKGGGPAWDPNKSKIPCVDESPHCKRIGDPSIGDCNGINKAFFAQSCKKSCGYCKPAAPTTAAPTTAAPTTAAPTTAAPTTAAPTTAAPTTAAPTTAAPTAQPPATGCTDKWGDNCALYAKYDLCSAVASYCAKSCNTCGTAATTTAAPCADDWSSCEDWYCSWGAKYCMKTCGKC